MGRRGVSPLGHILLKIFKSWLGVKTQEIWDLTDFLLGGEIMTIKNGGVWLIYLLVADDWTGDD